MWQKMYHSFGGHVVRHKNLVEQGQLLRRHETLRRRGLERRRRESRRLYRRGFTRWEGGEEKWRRRQSGGWGGRGGGSENSGQNRVAEEFVRLRWAHLTEEKWPLRSCHKLTVVFALGSNIIIISGA